MGEARGRRRLGLSSSSVDGQRRAAMWRPQFDGGAVMADLQGRMAGAQRWIGNCVQEGERTVAHCGKSFKDGKEILAYRFQGHNAWEKNLWTSVQGLGAQVQVAVHRTRCEMSEALVRMVKNMNNGGAPRPLLAAMSLGFHNRGNEVGLEAKHVFDIAMSTEQVARRLDGVPVYTVSNAANEFVLVSDFNTAKSLGIFCFREADAEALLTQIKDREPSLGRGAKVVAVSLDKVYQLNTEGIAFRFLPDPHQIKNALEARAKAGDPGRGFDGVPVFQSDNLILRSNNRRFCPIFFSKEDLESALKRAFKQQQRVNPALRVNTDIQVGSFEDVLKRMESNEEETGWGDIVFIPPGMDALSHLGKSQTTVVG